MSKRDPSSPDFPHGRNAGYTSGCRKTYPCPATPTCTEAHAQVQADYWQRRGRTNENKPTDLDGRIVKNVLARWDQTKQAASSAEVADFLGLTQRQITRHLTWLRHDAGTRTTHARSAELDRAWAWFVHGSDLRTVKKHGHHAYDTAYCRCRPCSDDASKNKKRWIAGYKKPEFEFTVDPRVSEHVNRLLEVAGTIGQLARITDYHDEGIGRIARDPQHPVRADVRARLLATSARQVRAARTDQNLTDPEPTRLRVGQMRALGYPIWWINTQAGFTPSKSYPAGRMVQRRTERAIETLHARIGDTPADPARDGLTPHTVTRTKNQARKEGYWPPMFYDDFGRLDWRAMPDHPWARTNSKADTWLRTARLLVDTTLTYDEIGERVGTSDTRARRATRTLGLATFPSGSRDLDASAEAVARVREVLDAWDSLRMSPLTAALTLGLMTPDHLARRDPHPDLVAWLADQDETEVAAA